jgi:N-acetylglutamate synthase-like GNAT family acetyltransferase
MIREANKFDIDACVEMMRRYAEESPLEMLSQSKHHNSDHVKSILTTLIAGRGFILIDNELRGMLAAIVTPNFWCPNIKEVKELAWWVHPDHRHSVIGGRLFVEFEKKSQEFIDQGKAHLVTLSLLSNSPQFDLSLRGFKAIEATYAKE